MERTPRQAAERAPHSAVVSEEVLVPDTRARLTPSQMVDRKLISMTETCPLLVSHLQDSVKRRPASFI
jgi:hypothetical protein